MTYIDRVERDSERKGAPRVERYFNGDSAVTIHCKVSPAQAPLRPLSAPPPRLLESPLYCSVKGGACANISAGLTWAADVFDASTLSSPAFCLVLEYLVSSRMIVESSICYLLGLGDVCF